MAKKRKYEDEAGQELNPDAQLSQLQSNSLRKRFIEVVIFSILLFVLYVWQFRSYELQLGRMVWIICVNAIVNMLDALISAHGSFIDDHRGGDEAEDSIHFYQSGKARSGGLVGLFGWNLFAIAMLNIIEWLWWHNHRPFFMVLRAYTLGKGWFLFLLVIIWIFSQLISHISQRGYLCDGRIKLLKQESGMI